MTLTLLEAALDWAERGVPVFPLHTPTTRGDGCSCNDGGPCKQDSPGKHPRTKNGVKDASQDPRQIREWWARWPDANIGGATGSASARWVLDVDGPEGEATLAQLEAKHGLLPPTLTITTGRGRHIWFLEPWESQVKNSASKVGPKLDTRGDGGYVVLPPSMHPSGSPYRVEREAQPDDAPEWLLQLVQRPNKPEKPAPTSNTAPLFTSADAARLAGYVRSACERIRAAAPGTRNDTVNAECYAVGGYLDGLGGTVDQVAPELEAAAHDAEQPVAMVRRSLEDGRRDSRGRPEDRPRPQAAQPSPTWPDSPPDDLGEPPPDTATLARLAHTDLGNARRFDLVFGADLRWCDPRGSWLVWNGRHWEWDERRTAQRWAQNTVERLADEVALIGQELAELPAPDACSADELQRRKAIEERQKAAAAHAKNSQGSARINAVPEQARALPGRSVSIADLDADPWLLVAANTTIDLRTCAVREHRRSDLVTRCLTVEYEPHALCPAWDGFVAQVLPDPEVRAFVQRLVGYSLTGDNREQRWALFTGEGSNGKSTLLDTIRWLLCGYATVLPARLLEVRQQDQHPTELMSLLGARFAVGSEPRKGAKWDAERIKSLTGDATIRARLMRQDDVEFTCTAKLFVSANELPRTDDLGHGFWRRIVVVPFTVTFEGAAIDTRLPAKLQAEGAGILNWAIRGLQDWQSRGLDVPAACLAETNKYRGEQDAVARFIAECCALEDDARERSGDMYAAYRNWFGEQGMPDRPVSNVQFGKALGRLPGVLAYDGAHKVRMWRGIRLAEKQSPSGFSWGSSGEDQHGH